MYCANCGTAAEEHLTYCKRCGIRLQNEIAAPNQTADAIAKKLSVALGFIGLGGFAVLAGIIAILVAYNVESPAMTFIIVAYLFTHLAICFMLLRNVSRMVTAAGKQTADMPRHTAPVNLPITNAAPLFREADTNPQIAAFQPPASVTEHTTRTLDAVLREGK